MPAEKEILEGTIEQIIFQAPDSMYTVALFSPKGKKMETVCGAIPQAHENMKLKLEGEWVDHARYGRQFKIEKVEVLEDQGKDAIIGLLSSSHFEGIGKKTAGKIVDALGEDAISIINEDPNVLVEKCHLNPEKAQVVAEGVKQYESLGKQLLMLMGWGLKEKEINLLVNHYSDLNRVLENDCFAPMYDVHGFGYAGVLKIADGMKVPFDDIRRLEAAIYDRLCSMIAQSGNTYIPMEDLYKEYQGVLPEDLKKALKLLEDKDRIQISNNKIYPYNLDKEEWKIARRLYEHDFETNAPTREEMEEQLAKIEKQLAITYDPVQKEGIFSFFEHSLMILTGGPGTGKSTTIKGILEMIPKFLPQCKVQLCAPTGRAAKRMGQLADQQAKTIHSLLRWEKDSDQFGRGKNDPLECDILIVDEFSMVDTRLFASLLAALPDDCRIILIGDEDQLPSVGPGKVLNDLIASDVIHTVKLKTLFRQASGSGIAQLADEIRREVKLTYSDGVQFLPMATDQILPTVLDIYDQYGQDVQILAPKYKGSAGIDAINQAMQDKYNPFSPYKPEIRAGSRTFREGDRVLLKKNMPEADVFNGDIGIIEEVDGAAKALAVDFDDNIVEFEGDLASTMNHAWCMSVHKSQGSEYQNVAVIVDSQAWFMLNKRLLYTAISRAKKNLFILGDRNLFERAVRQQPQFERKTTLCEKLQKMWEE